MTKVIVDLYGSDLGENEVLKGCYLALDENRDLHIFVCGNKNEIEEKIDSKYKDRIDILHSLNTVTCEDNPLTVPILKKTSSLITGLKYFKEHKDEFKCFISSGSTAALITSSFFLLDKKEGVKRLALAPILPTINNSFCIFLDSGANVNVDAESLTNFALMGSQYFMEKFNKEKVNLAYLSNGTESTKGTKEIRESIKQILNYDYINFKGQIEAREILSGEYDVIVTDGFAGNIALKSYEGMAKTIFKLLKSEINKNGIKAKIGALLLKPSLTKIANKLDYNKQNGGAILLGLEQRVVKAHGSSKAEAFKQIIKNFIY